ncbi:MAG: DUF6516 family protein [Candidatus Methanoperedens sp.]|nr:DUF6516 family protein [Candidatus Methanoperedens sp.]MCZ7396644.1 DUF6516 family protein [Candidatus Methanoperedens sp.]
MHRVINILRESRIVDSILSIDSDAFGEYYKLKIQVRLVNGWKLHVWEHATPKIRRYAYHVSKGQKLIIRWDNAPHHKQIRTFPHHKHVKEAVLESKERMVEDILIELERMIQEES